MKLLAVAFALLQADRAHSEPNVIRDLDFARVGDQALKLDLHLPPAEGPARTPLFVYVHGGTWRAGSRIDMPLGELVAQGFAVASVDYRLSTVAPFPAQAHDLKAAIRFLRALGADYQLDPLRIAIIISPSPHD